MRFDTTQEKGPVNFGYRESRSLEESDGKFAEAIESALRRDEAWEENFKEAMSLLMEVEV